MLFPDLTAYVEAVDIRQHNVQNRQIRLHFFHTLERIRTIRELMHDITVIFQINLKQIGNLFLILRY
jgi:hypothetical protein